MRSKPLDLRSVIGSLSRSNAKHPSPARVQPESNLTEVIRRNRSKNKCRHVRERCPSIPPSRPPSVFDGSDAPRPAATRGCRHHSQRGRFVKVSCMKKDSTNPGMAAALRTCPVTPCPVQHGDRVRAQSNRVRHGEQASEPAAYYRPIRVIPEPRNPNIN